MKSCFKLIGLSRPQCVTCELVDSEVTFIAKNGLSEQKFKELWNYCKDNWGDKKVAEIEYDRLSDNGTPINPIVVNISEI